MKKYIRKDFLDIVPYSSARDEFEGKSEVYLDANENPLTTEFNRYPDPYQKELKKEIGKRKGLNPNNLVLGNGSDEMLDLVFRLIGMPHQDAVAFLDPSYGMYSVLAKLNGLSVQKIPLDNNFKILADSFLEKAKGAKLCVICNPNNPTGNVFSKEFIEEILTKFEGVVVIDEAYIDFCSEYSFANRVNDFDNLIVLQTLSKAYGMAGLRIGIAIANNDWVNTLNSVKPPYNLSSLVQARAIQDLQAENWSLTKQIILSERERLMDFLRNSEKVIAVFESEANFILFRVDKAQQMYDYLLANGVVVRNRSTQWNCENTLRVSVGTEKENERFIQLIKDYQQTEVLAN